MRTHATIALYGGSRMNIKDLRRRIAFLLTLLPVSMFALILGATSTSELRKQLVEFYVVDVWDDDFYPYWQTSILHVLRRGSGVKVAYTYLASATQPCNDPELKGGSALLPDARIEDLTEGLNLCVLDSTSFNEKVEKYSRKPEAFNTMRSALVARCGTEARVFHLPLFRMDFKALKRIEPSAKPMSQIGWRILRRAFPDKNPRDLTWGVDSSLKQIMPDSPEVEELKKTPYDEAYWFGFPGVHPAIPAQVVTSFDPTLGSDSDLGKLRNVLGRYKHLPVSGGTVLLVSSEGNKFQQYVAPEYGRLAYQAGLQGRVELSLSLDRNTRRVENVIRVSGNALLAAVHKMPR